MPQVRKVATLVALAGVAVLPACSMFGGNRTQASRASSPSQGYASTQQNYPSPQSPELTQDTLKQVQERLQQQGMYHGRIDGVWGRGTEAAVRSYQQQHNLNASGKLDVDTLASLNLGTNQNYGAAPQQPPGQQYGSSTNPPANTSLPANNATQPDQSGPR